MECVLGLDVGTSSVKAMLVDAAGRVRGLGRAPYPTQRPGPGCSEQRPADWLDAASAATGQARNACPSAQVAAVGCAGHMSAPVLVDAAGEPVAACRTLTDARAQADLPEDVRAEIEARTGNRGAAHFTLPKLLWWRRHDPAVLARAARVLTPKDFVGAWLSGVAATDPTDAGNTLLLDPLRRAWMPDIARAAGIDPALLLPLREPGTLLGALRPPAAARLGLPSGVPVAMGAADMAAALLGTGLRDDEMLVTLGTSANVVAHVAAPDPALLGRLTCHPGARPGTLFALGSHLGGGACLDWLAALLGGPDRLRAAAAKIAAGAIEAEGLLFLPYLVGAGSPDFDPAARGAFLGLAATHRPAHLLRAVIEGITADLCLSIDLLDHGRAPRPLVLSGGGAHLQFWPAVLADLAVRPVAGAPIQDTSTLGAALLAGVAVGWFGGSVAAATQAARAREPAAAPRADRAAFRARYAAARHGLRTL